MEKEKISNRKATFIAFVLCLTVLTIFALYQIFFWRREISILRTDSGKDWRDE